MVLSFFSSMRLAWWGRAMLGFVLSAAGLMAAGKSPGKDEVPAGIASLVNLSFQTQFQPVDGGTAEKKLRAGFYESVPYNGHVTKIYAWLGLPEKVEGKVPAMVLVHGGGGTAFSSWVKKWNRLGYAAISIAVEGQTDVRQDPSKPTSPWVRHAWAGPARDGIYGDADAPLQEQWMYHATAATILARTLLASLPEVDPQRIGVMGVSWGGIVTATVLGLDPRFALGVIVYGCGFLGGSDNFYGEALRNHQGYREIWDPGLRLQRCQVPTLWISWPGDTHFSMEQFAESYRRVGGPKMVSLIPSLGHGHEAAWNRPESYTFAERVFRDGKPWIRQTTLLQKGRQLTGSFLSEIPVEKARLVWSTERGFTGGRTWQEAGADFFTQGGSWTVSADLPEGTTAAFLNLYCSGRIATSDYWEIPPRP